MTTILQRAFSLGFVRPFILLMACLAGLHLVRGMIQSHSGIFTPSVWVDVSILFLCWYVMTLSVSRHSTLVPTSPVPYPMDRSAWSPSIRKIELSKALIAVEKVLAQRSLRAGPPEYIWKQELEEIHDYLIQRLSEIGLQPQPDLLSQVQFIDRSAASTQNYSQSMAQGLMSLIEKEWRRQTPEA